MEGGSTGALRDQDSEVYKRAFPTTVYASKAALAQRRPASAFILNFGPKVIVQIRLVNGLLHDAVVSHSGKLRIRELFAQPCRELRMP